MNRKKYILGSGLHWPPAADTVRVDILPGDGVDMVCDLNAYPWPIAAGAALHVNASHLLEHLENPVAFMDECWRILSPGGTLYVEVPDAASVDLAWADPTHKRPYRVHSFINYFTVEGVHKFGYSRHAWAILHLRTDGAVIRGHFAPIPDEYLTDETLKRLANE